MGDPSVLAAPILVTGFPRSGTSFVTGTLARCGAWTGPTRKGSDANPHGFYENMALWRVLPRRSRLVDHVTNPTGRLGGDVLRGKIKAVLGFQGYPGGPWAFKAVAAIFNYEDWVGAWPDTRVVVPWRARANAVRSNVEWLPGHATEEEWGALYDDIMMRVSRIADPIVVNVDAVMAGSETMEPVVRTLGLDWTDEAERFCEPKLWNRWPK